MSTKQNDVINEYEKERRDEKALEEWNDTKEDRNTKEDWENNNEIDKENKSVPSLLDTAKLDHEKRLEVIKENQKFLKDKSIGFHKSDKTIDRIYMFETKLLADREKDKLFDMESFIKNVLMPEAYSEGYALGRKDQDKYE